MNPIGIVQGRLSPPPPGRLQQFPWASWEREFGQAQALGFDGIEWVFAAEQFEHNPIWSERGRSRIRALSLAHHMPVLSVCADYFMEVPLASQDPGQREAGISMLQQLIDRCAALDVRRILVPFLEGGSLRGVGRRAQAVQALRRCLPVAASRGVELALETDLPGAEYARLLSDLDHPQARAYYDTGNAAAEGYDIAEDARALFPWLAAVHVKDRTRHGPSVPLGEGDAGFEPFFQVLVERGYAGPFVLQTAFGPDFEVFARRHLHFVRSRLVAHERPRLSLEGGHDRAPSPT